LKKPKSINLTNIALIATSMAIAAICVFIINDATRSPGGATTRSSDSNKAASTVMIVTNSGRSGGTGVIVSTEETKSKVLTNLHVCKEISKGGEVVTDGGQRSGIVSYKESQEHDLCLITVAAKIGPSAEIASKSPALYSESTISGHPHLLPTVITKGNFSGHKTIEVHIGTRPCTDADSEKFKADGNIVGPLMCVMLGGIPELRTYDAQLTNALIQPGSSGSAVYDSSGRVAGLAFAVEGDLGYGWIVPQEAVYNFMYSESKFITEKLIDTSDGVFQGTPSGTGSDEEEVADKAEQYCETKPSDDLGKRFCRALKSDTIYKENLK
jgi:hypothetical protein